MESRQDTIEGSVHNPGLKELVLGVHHDHPVPLLDGSEGVADCEVFMALPFYCPTESTFYLEDEVLLLQGTAWVVLDLVVVKYTIFIFLS